MNKKDYIKNFILQLKKLRNSKKQTKFNASRRKIKSEVNKI